MGGVMKEVRVGVGSGHEVGPGGRRAAVCSYLAIASRLPIPRPTAHTPRPSRRCSSAWRAARRRRSAARATPRRAVTPGGERARPRSCQSWARSARKATSCGCRLATVSSSDRSPERRRTAAPRARSGWSLGGAWRPRGGSDVRRDPKGPCRGPRQCTCRRTNTIWSPHCRLLLRLLRRLEGRGG